MLIQREKKKSPCDSAVTNFVYRMQILLFCFLDNKLSSNFIFNKLNIFKYNDVEAPYVYCQKGSKIMQSDAPQIFIRCLRHAPLL